MTSPIIIQQTILTENQLSEGLVKLPPGFVKLLLSQENGSSGQLFLCGQLLNAAGAPKLILGDTTCINGIVLYLNNL